MAIRELLNKLVWDPRESPAEWSLVYLDFGKPKEIPFSAVKAIERAFILLEDGTELPLHRIRQLKKAGKVVWQR